MMAIPNLLAIKDWCLKEFAKKTSIPTKTSDLDNDSGFVTSQYPVEILDEEQTEANTTPDKYVSDAMVTKELLLRQNGVQWIVDEDTGAIKGYKTKVGADTEFPFSGSAPVTLFGYHYGGQSSTCFEISNYNTLTLRVSSANNTYGLFGLNKIVTGNNITGTKLQNLTQNTDMVIDLSQYKSTWKYIGFRNAGSWSMTLE